MQGQHLGGREAMQVAFMETSKDWEANCLGLP